MEMSPEEFEKAHGDSYDQESLRKQYDDSASQNTKNQGSLQKKVLLSESQANKMKCMTNL